MPSPLAQRLSQAMSEMPPPSPTKADLARVAGVKPPSVSDWFSGKTLRLGKSLVPVARFLQVTPEWLNDGRLPKHPPDATTLKRVGESFTTYGAAFEIAILDAPGSCGGGRGGARMDEGSITKEASWFKSRGVTPGTVVAVVADGDGNADYISHGDVVFFNTASTTPESGMIFLLRHPDGLRIKRLRRDIDGTWLLEYVSQDKRRFPDERIPHERIATLEIVGKFIYRQGG